MSLTLYAGTSLTRQLELAEAHNNLAFVETQAQVDPEHGVAWLEVAGAYAMFNGPDSPLTQIFGLRVFEEVKAAHLAELESLLLARNAPMLHEVSPR